MYAEHLRGTELISPRFPQDKSDERLFKGG